MAEAREQQTEAGNKGTLLVLTGASHTGKSSVAAALLDLVPPPAACVGVDQIIDDVLARPPGDPWLEIPLAYELLRPQVEILLRRGWLVVVESTFTFVPSQGDAQFHLDELEALLGLARRLAVPHAVVQLLLDRPTAKGRAGETGRLDPAVVEKTVELHEAASLPPQTLTLSSRDSSPEELAEEALGHMRLFRAD